MYQKTCSIRKDIRNYIQDEIQKYNCKPSFSLIVTVGANAFHPHQKANNKNLQGCVVIDCGVVYQRWISDMTRTVYIGTPPTEKHLYRLVRFTHHVCISFVQAGGCAHDLDWIARKLLGGYAQYCIHSLGHGIGKHIH